MRNVILIGLISFFADVGTEMVYPLIPLYLTTVFGASPALIGLVEGIAESTASLLRVLSGHLTDRYRHKKLVAFTGYSTGLLYKLGLLAATSWTGVLAARVTDRIGKGLRTAPRDVLVFESADPEKIGKAYGMHKMLDMSGTSLGVLIAFLLLHRSEGDYNFRQIFLLSMVPTVIALLIFSGVREKKLPRPSGPFIPFWKNIRQLDSQLRLYLLVAFTFTLGYASDAFLLLRARSIGFSAPQVVLLYFVSTVTAAILALPFGRLSDRVGRKRLLVTGYTIYAVAYAGFALALSQPFLVVCFALYGVHIALVTGVERAYIAEIAPPALKGTMLGLHSTLVGVALLPASIIAGQLWNTFGAAVPFVVGSSLAFAAAATLGFLMRRAPLPPPPRPPESGGLADEA
jgi:MFS family permease